MFKNVASQKFIVFAFDATTNLPKTGDAANITAYVSKDFGAVTVLGDVTATEMDATNAKGYYLFDAAQAESNADVLLVSAKSATANIVVIGAPAVIFTQPPNLTALGVTAGGHISNVDTLTTYTGNTPQTGDNYARLGAPAGASVSADIAAIKADTGTILTDVNTGAGAIYTRIGAPAGASIAADIAALPTAAVVKTQVVAALVTDTYSEPAAVPAATSSLKDKICYLFTKTRNKLTQTNAQQALRNDGDSANIATASVSDDGITFTKGKDT